jgi:cytochrome c5
MLCTVLVLAACGKGLPEASPADERRAEAARPTDALLAQKYERACLTCHASIVSKAPLTGFAAHWQVRLQQGIPTLVAHVRDGFQGMPARGFCNDCSDQDFAALIVFMSQPHSSKE